MSVAALRHVYKRLTARADQSTAKVDGVEAIVARNLELLESVRRRLQR